MFNDAYMLSSGKQILTIDCMPACRRPATNLQRLVKCTWRAYGQSYLFWDVSSAPPFSPALVTY